MQAVIRQRPSELSKTSGRGNIGQPHGSLGRYGVAVLLGASPDAERALRERLSARTENPYESVESEELLEDEFEIHERSVPSIHCESSGTS